jgi:transcriptional regulator with XRE-family HTH domain
MKITDKIRELRMQKNLSQEYVASFLGIDTSSYHRLERGVSPLTVQRLELIAQAFEISLSDLFDPTDSDKMKVDMDDTYIIHLEEEIRFLRAQLHENIQLLTANANDTQNPSRLPSDRNRSARG